MNVKVRYLILGQFIDQVLGTVEHPPPDDGCQQHVVLIRQGAQDGFAFILLHDILTSAI